MSDGYYLFFTPEAGVVPHFTMQALLARILVEKGNKVLFVRCHSMYPHCPVMDMYLLPHDNTKENQQKVCGQCLQASETILGAYALESIDMKDFLSVEIIERINSAMEDMPGDLREFTFDGLPFGTLTVIDLVLATKVSDFAGLSEEMRAIWCKYITNALLSYLLTLEIMGKFPIRGIVHHEDYGLLLAARLAGRKHGIPSIHVGFTGQLGGDRRRVYLMHKAGSGDEQKTMTKWGEWRDLCLPPEKVPEPMDDLLARLGSISARVYSPKKTFDGKDLFAELGLPRDKKLLVAYTSSLDERLAVDSVVDALNQRFVSVTQPWPNQIEWLKSVLEFVGKSDEYHLVVRVHPREGANKRESRISQHLLMLKEAFDRPLVNATFIWPGMEVSSYDLAEIADLVLTAWTTLGLEVGRLGVPVLASTYALAPRPNDDFHVWAPTQKDYFAKIKEMVGQPPSLDTVLHAFRWHMVQYLGHTVDLSDIIPTSDFHGLPKFFLPAASGDVENVIVNGMDMLDVNRGRLEAVQWPGALSAERVATRAQLRRGLRFLFTGEEKSPEFRLVLAESDDSPQAFLAKLGVREVEPGTAILLMRGGALHFLEADKSYARYSKMGARLGVLACDTAWHVTVPLPPEAKILRDEADLRAQFRAEGSGSADQAFANATRLKDEGKIAEARELAAGAVSRGHQSAELLNLLGHLECLSGNNEAGKLMFQRVVRIWPSFAKAFNNLSVLYWNSGDKGQALQQLVAGLKADPYSRDLVANAVIMFKALGETNQAAAIINFYLKKYPDDAGFFAGL